MTYSESHLRSIVKVISWRVLITISHILNGLMATGSLILGIKIAGMALIINSILFWTHERGWNFFQWNRKDDPKLTFHEGQPRSLGKVISWRVLITASNFVIPFIITGSWGQAALFTGMATVVNMVLFWGHERIWNRIKWQKKTIQEISE